MPTPDRETALRVALAWRELRRGASGMSLRAHLTGTLDHRLELAQLDALEIVASEPEGWRMTDFADALHVNPSNATRAVDRLEQLGLAERSRAAEDKRVVTVRSTPEGRRLVQKVSRLKAQGVSRLLEVFDEDELSQFAEYLERFVGSIDQLVEELERNR